LQFLRQAAEFLPILLQGIRLTVIVTAGSLALATVLGLVWALLRALGPRPVGIAVKLLINVIRGIPVIVQLFYVYFVLPDFGLSLTAVQAGIVGLGVAYSAYHSENFRAGIEAVGRGQIEAGLSLGLHRFAVMRTIVLPQAFRIALPPYGNLMVMMLKDSSQASTITVAELALEGKLIASSTFENTTVFTLVALLYLCMSIPLILFAGWLERRGAGGR